MIYLSFEVNKELDYLDLIGFIGIACGGTCCKVLDNKWHFHQLDSTESQTEIIEIIYCTSMFVIY